MKTRMKLRMKRTPKRYIRREPRWGVLVVVVDSGWRYDAMGWKCCSVVGVDCFRAEEV